MASLIDQIRGTTTPTDEPSRLIRQQRAGIDALKRNREAVAESGVKVSPRPERTYGGVVDPNEPMRDGQRGLVYVLLGKLKTHNPDVYATASAWWEDGRQDSITKVACSGVIDRLRANLEAPAVSAPATTPPAPVDAPTRKWDGFDDVPNGYYALATPDTVDEIHYYRVSRSRDGRYVRVAEQASSTFYPVRPWPRAAGILNRLRETGLRDAAYLYGTTIGRCCRCNRTLTDEASRAMGIGPDCAGKGDF